MSLLELLLAENVQAFNATRGERQRVELFASDFAGLNLAGVDLSGADVDKSDLTEAVLTDSNLFRVQMNGIDGTGMKLNGAVALRGNFKEAYLDASDLSGADFSKADLSEAVLTDSLGDGFRAPGARLREVDASNARWPGCDLTEAVVTKANFSQADLSRATLIEIRGGEADFSGCRLDAAIATGATLVSANLVGASLAGARFDRSNLSGANLTNANLTGADLSGANLAGATLTGATLTGVVLAEAVLDGVDLADLDLSGVDLSGLDADVLGLSPKQRGAVAAVGVPVVKDAPLAFGDVFAARGHDKVLVIWENEDTETVQTLRYVVLGKGTKRFGVLPVSTDALLARAAVATADGFEALTIIERAGQVRALRFPIDIDGKLSAAESSNPGYEPAVLPVVTSLDGRMVVYGLSRRGPTLVVHAVNPTPGAEGEPSKLALVPVQSVAATTARGFVSRHAPVLGSKGGALIPCSLDGLGKPLRPADGFPGTTAVAAPVADGLVTVWAEPPVKADNSGGLRWAMLRERGAPEVEQLAKGAAVQSLDAVAVGEVVWVAWVEADRKALGATKLRLATLPDADVKQLDVPDLDEVQLVVDARDSAPWLVAVTGEGGLWVGDARGKVVAHVRAGGA